MSPEATITRLVAPPGAPDRVVVHFDDQAMIEVSLEVVAMFGLTVGRRLTAGEQEQLTEADQFGVARAMALRYLAARARTTHEVRQKLRQVPFSEPVVEQVVERLRTLGYLDDRAYAQAYVESRLTRQGYGPQRIRRELLHRGIPAPVAEAVLATLAPSDDVAATARHLAEQRWERLRGEPNVQKRRRKLADYLLRRGFPGELVQKVVAQVSRLSDH
jgi:regulatory protein